MPVVAISPGTVTYSGVDGGGESNLAVEPSEPIIYSGVPIGFEVADTETPTTSPDAVRARVLDEDGVFICHLPHVEGLNWLDEHNSAGSGSVDYRRYGDLESEHPAVWTPGNQVVISVGSLDVFRIVLDAEPSYRLDANGDRVDAWAGLGALGVLNSGMIEPEYGWRPESTDERSFDYGSNPAIGGWVVASEWKTPVGKPVRKSWRWTYKKRHLPKGWPDRRAQWLWWKNPDGTGVPDEICYFRSSFTLANAARVKFWVCGDDTLEFQVDGEIRATAGPGGWKKPTKIVLNLSAGTHRVAAKVQNTPATDGKGNRSGFLCTIARVERDGDVIAYVRRTTPGTWSVRRQLSGPPGWFAAQIAKRLIDEAKGRDCAGHAAITYGFTTTTDSYGAAWTARRDMGLTVGTVGLEWMQRLVETGIDVHMTPALKLHLYRRRGVDRSRTVRLDQGEAHALDESGVQPPGIRNVLYARAKTGWVGRSAGTSITNSGRRESVVTLGSSRSSTQTAAALAAMINDLAYPPQTIDVKISGAAGNQPYRHFHVADWVSYKAAGATTWRRYRVMSIAGEVHEAGHPVWTLKLYED